MTVVAAQATPFRCCDVVNCECTEYNGPSCEGNRAALVAGLCDGGYRCCRTECWSCNCRTVRYHCKKSTCSRRSCSTCCRCASSVSRHQCQTVCGTCFAPVASVTYSYKGVQLLSAFRAYCGRDNTACKDSFISQYPLGGNITGYVNPEQPLDIRRDVAYRTGPLVAFLVFAIGSAFPLAAAFVRAIRKNANRPREADVSMTDCSAIPESSRQSRRHLTEKYGASELSFKGEPPPRVVENSAASEAAPHAQVQEQSEYGNKFSNLDV
jgi:hypothetical protein